MLSSRPESREINAARKPVKNNLPAAANPLRPIPSPLPILDDHVRKVHRRRYEELIGDEIPQLQGKLFRVLQSSSSATENALIMRDIHIGLSLPDPLIFSPYGKDQRTSRLRRALEANTALADLLFGPPDDLPVGLGSQLYQKTYGRTLGLDSLLASILERNRISAALERLDNMNESCRQLWPILESLVQNPRT